MGDSHGQAGVGTRFYRNPLTVHRRIGVIVKGVDKYRLNTLVFQPLAPDDRLLPGIDSPGRVRVVGPENNHLGMLKGILQQVILFRHTYPPEKTIGMSGSPVPALPAIRIVKNWRIVNHLHEASKRPHLVPDNSPVVVRRGHPGNRRGSMFLPDPFNFTGDDINSFVPAYPLISRFAAIFRIALTMRIEINAFHRVLDSILRIQTISFRINKRWYRHFSGWSIIPVVS